MYPPIAFDPSFITAFLLLSAWLEELMKFFSFLGSENFFLISMPLLYWSVDAALGVRVWFILLAGTSLNQYFKMALHAPRPYWVSTDVRALDSDPGFSLPSAHAEMGAGLWGMIAAYYRRGWGWVAAVLLVFFIGLSRVYLGVHYPLDVAAGWALGFLTLWVYVRFWDPVAAYVRRLSFWKQVGLALVVSLAMVLVGAVIAFLSRDFVLPAEWIANAVRDGNVAPNPFSMDALITAAATLFGSASGLAWMAPRGGFSASGALWKRAARFVVGMIGVAILYAGLKSLFPSGDALVPYIFRYIRYAFLGFWIAGVAPWVFAKLRLAESNS